MKPKGVSRGIEGARLLVTQAQEYGAKTADCLRGTGISEATLRDTSGEVSGSQQLALIRNLIRLLPDRPALGHEVGRRSGVSESGILGYALLSSATTRNATEFALRYGDLRSSFTRFKSERGTAGELIITFDDSAIPNDCRQFVVEWEVTATTALLRDMVRERVPLQKIEFRFERPRYAETLIEFFRCPISFGCEENRSILDAACADRPLPQANEHVLQLCEEQCRELLDRRRARSDVAEQVRRCLLRPGADRNLESVAGSIGLSGRTLRRRLHDEGTNFRKLVDEVRFALAEEMLRRNLTVEEVAERVGYSEPASFIHAFKRWTGSPPGSYRSRS